jgi:hypothetical protein
LLIAEEVGLHVTGLVDSAVASVVTSAVPEQFTFIDVSLHRLFTVAVEGGKDVSRGAWQEITELSLSALLNAWLNLISDRFVRETRFDPLALAETEQQIYDAVYHWLARGALGAKLAVEVRHRESSRRIDIPQEASSKGTPALRDRGTRARRFADHPLPPRRGAGSSRRLWPHAAAWSCCRRTRCSPALSDTSTRSFKPRALRLVTQLPSNGTPRVRAPVTAAPDARALWCHRRTHRHWLTLASDVHRLPIEFNDGAAGIAAAADGQRLSLVPGAVAAVNRTPARDGMVLSAGDQIELGGARFHLIRVLDRA